MVTEEEDRTALDAFLQSDEHGNLSDVNTFNIGVKEGLKIIEKKMSKCYMSYWKCKQEYLDVVIEIKNKEHIFEWLLML